MVPYTVEQTKSYTVSDPTAQLKEDIKRVKDKLDTIQPGPDPSLKKLQDDLKEIKDLLKKTPTPTSRVRDRVDNCERLVASMVQREYREWLDAAEQRRVQAKLISHDSRRVVIERADGKVFSVELEKLSKSDQEFALAIH
jgi:septal ring factor EnvC (AmiA/AmiB activator)